MKPSVPLSRIRPLALVIALLLWLVPAHQGRADAHVFSAAGGVALGGTDVVSYFTEGAPEPGDPAHSVMWKGVVWHFASRANRERFEANPWAYAPQYGGYCAYGVSKGQVLGADPSVWRIRNGKLYLIHSKDIWSLWSHDIPGHIDTADAKWPAVLAAH